MCVCVFVRVCVRACKVDLDLYFRSNQLDVLPPRKNMMSCFESYGKQKERAAGKTAELQQPLYLSVNCQVRDEKT